jgi:DNA/RNA endonuclease G (NUC1)
MNTVEKKQYRFPGTRPFTQDDRAVFFGRKDDIVRLSNLIKLEQQVVLFGKSGLGKSSLLNAGILPDLRENHKVLPLSIRFGYSGTTDDLPSKIFLSTLQPSINFDIVLWNKLVPDWKKTWMLDPGDESFWLAGKSLQLSHPDKTILLVFDQFEELFTYPENEISRFAFLLSTLLFGQMPQSVQNMLIDKLEGNKKIFTDHEISTLYETINIKLIFSIRSDHVGLLNRFKKYIPQILQKTYELKPLTIAQARDAMLLPAGIEGNFFSDIFHFHPSAEEKILSYLSKKGEKYIETFQLQLICQFCENLIIRKSAENTVDPEKLQDLCIEPDDTGDLSTIFTRHYDFLLNEIQVEAERHAARRLIEENMIIDNNRVPLPDKVIHSKYNVGDELLQKLVDSRLIRCEPNTTGGFSYEISHDTLVEPIINSYKIRKEKEDREEETRRLQEELRVAREKTAELISRKKRFIVIFSIILLFALTSFLSAYLAFTGRNQTRVLNAKLEKEKEIVTKEKNRADSSLILVIQEKMRADSNLILMTQEKKRADSILMSVLGDEYYRENSTVDFYSLFLNAGIEQFNLANYQKALSFFKSGLNYAEIHASKDMKNWIGKSENRLALSMQAESDYLNNSFSNAAHLYDSLVILNPNDNQAIERWRSCLNSLNIDPDTLLGNPSGAQLCANDTNYLMLKRDYVLSYNDEKKISNWVSWYLAPCWLAGLYGTREDKFLSDETLPSSWQKAKSSDYSQSGYDRGHLCPAGDRKDSPTPFLLTNIVPQTPESNRSTWKYLEDYSRSLAKRGNELYIVAGTMGSIKRIGNTHVTVPLYLWKIIVVLPLGQNDLQRMNENTRVIAVKVPNEKGLSRKWGDYRVSVHEIEKLTGYHFFSSLAEPVQKALKEKVDNGPSE